MEKEHTDGRKAQHVTRSGAHVCTNCDLYELAPVGYFNIDQHGRIQAIGGVNEKVEGFFDICQHFGLTGSQGVIIPESNAGDLMLRHDIVEAARDGRFAVYPVRSVHEALALFTGHEVGEWSDGYPEASLLGIARARARGFWEETVRGPDRGQAAE